METTRPPYTQRNVVVACVSLLLALGYLLLLNGITADVKEKSVNGYEGEAAFIVEIPLLFLLVYTGLFSLVTLVRALQRGSEPIPGAQVLLGLLPTVIFVLLAGWLMWHWTHRVV